MLRGSYHNGFAPRDGMPMYPSLWRGCVGAWAPCLGPTGLTLRDWSGFANHGTLTGMTADTDWVSNAGRYALDFDGTVSKNDEVIVATSSTRFALPANGGVSVCGWIFNRSFPSYSTVQVQELWQHGPNNTTNGEWYMTQSSQKAVFQIWQAGAVTATGTTTLQTGVWYHLCGTWDGATIRVFVNGVQEASAAATITATSLSATTRIGRLGVTNYEYSVDGNIDDVRVYRRTLSPNEIALLASRRGIAYDLAPMAMPYSEQVAGFNAAWALRQRLILGGGGGMG